MLTDTRKSAFAKVTGDIDIKWTGGFWKEAVDACAKQMVPHLQNKFEDKEISHVLENFRICAGDAEGDFDGTVFGDGDFYKWMEAELYAADFMHDGEKFEKLEEYISLIARAQQEDGYISTKQIIEQRKGIGAGRMGDINDFEVYNMGHLFTSACLHKRITGKDSFLHIAERAASYLQNMYDEAEKKGEVKTAVCPSHYMGLIELYRTTENEKYLLLADKAMKLRDSVKNGLDDNQDRIPLKEHEKIMGHAVRASYLYAGVADLYMESGEEAYLDMLHKVWNNMLQTKIYLTGGIGALYNGASPYGNFFIDQKIHQAFGYEYQLPNVTAYNETCASIGLVMWAYRMFLIEPKAEYFDVIERAMLNTNLAAVSLDGKKYFYENMLRRAKKLEYELVWPLTRSEYILSYCCPPNLARVLMQSEEYAYTISKDEVFIGMYGESTAKMLLQNGAEFTLIQSTAYPYDGTVIFQTEKVKHNIPINLKLRIPKWAESGLIQVNGSEMKLTRENSGTYYSVLIEDLENMKVELRLDMPVRYTMAHPMVEEDTCQVAVERGPLVYCVETSDVDVETLDDISLNTESEYTSGRLEMCGRIIHTLHGSAYKLVRENYNPTELYQPLRKMKKEKIDIRFIPYFAWDNRAYGEMKIWMPYV